MKPIIDIDKKEFGLCKKYPKCFSNYYSYNQCPKFKSDKNKCTRYYEYRKDLDDIMKEVRNEKVGHWIKYADSYDKIIGEIPYSGGVMCSECGWKTHKKLHLEFGCSYVCCPKCGTRMESEEE